VSDNRRIIRVPSEMYVFTEIDPEDVQLSAKNIMTALGSLRSFTYLHPIEEVAYDEAPKEVRKHFENKDLAVYAITPEDTDDEGEDAQEPISLRFAEATEPSKGEWLCRLHSSTYVTVDADPEDAQATWQQVREQLGGPTAVSIAQAEVEVLSPKAATEDVYTWILYGAVDRVVVPLWPSEVMDDLDNLWAWKEAPLKIEERAPYRGAYVRVVAVHPEHVRGMQCRMWHVMRNDKSGLGTVRGKYPVDVAVSVPSEKRTAHIHSFHSVKNQDWRPGLVFYGRTDEDGCPLNILGERLEQYYTEKGWVNEQTWRSWLED